MHTKLLKKFRTKFSLLLQWLAICYLRRGRLLYFKRYGAALYLLPNIMGYQMLLEFLRVKRYEKGAVDLLARYVNEGDVLDVGANEGFYSLCLGALAKKSKNRIFAFEPLQSNLDLLRRNIAINKLTDRVEVIPSAVGSFEGEITLYVPNYGSYATTMLEVAPENSKSLLVPISTLDRILKTRSDLRVSLIKIDVEGSEYDVLLGAVELIKTCRPAIFMELELQRQPEGQKSLDKIIDFLRKNGYSLYSHTHRKKIRPYTGDSGSGHNLYAIADC